jgi:DNA replication protein DnaC
MRHDPAAGAIVIMLRSLKMYGMAQAVTDLIEQGAPAFEAAIPMLSQLLKAELAEREVRSIAYHMKSARFPAYKDLSGFDFATSEVNEATVRTLHRCEFMDGAQNVVLIGGPGTGKTHVATALGIQAIEHHRRKVRFFSTIELVNALEQEKAKGKAGQIAEGMTKLDLVILDELGYLPFSASGGALLFHLLSKLYERTSVVITTNLSFSEWATRRVDESVQAMGLNGISKSTVSKLCKGIDERVFSQLHQARCGCGSMIVWHHPVRFDRLSKSGSLTPPSKSRFAVPRRWRDLYTAAHQPG